MENDRSWHLRYWAGMEKSGLTIDLVCCNTIGGLLLLVKVGTTSVVS